MRRRKWVMVWALTAALTCSACGKDAEELAEQKGLKTLEKAPEIASEKEPDSSGEKQETAETKETMEKSVSDTTESGGGKENAAVLPLPVWAIPGDFRRNSRIRYGSEW